MAGQLVNARRGGDGRWITDRASGLRRCQRGARGQLRFSSRVDLIHQGQDTLIGLTPWPTAFA
ncbi:hypothetical protein DI396_07330 [Litorivita pollutaquae]|uniref:Uncharacterized protein n=1 Tax=Litorivita pollutaquae TaxID=2200892 RepID=A0A2V4NST1_9RHOB|nr:hypothetical protein DI396_07330 [Litorivita pollutaquae]